MYREAVEIDRERGEAHIARAHALTEFRRQSAPPVEAMAAGNGNVLAAVATGAVMTTDAFDGRYARQGAELLGIPTSPEGALEDPRADKAVVDGIMRGLLARYIRQRNYLSALVMGANLAASHWRDGNMAKDRALVEEHGVDSEMLKAISTNKTKAAGQMVAGLAAIGSDNARVRRGALGAFSAATFTGIIGERQYRNRIHKLIKSKQRA